MRRGIALLQLLAAVEQQGVAVDGAVAGSAATRASCAALASAALGANVSVLSAAEAVATAYQRNDTVPYCLVKLLGKPAIHIWVGLPMGGFYNGRLQVTGGSGYAGSIKQYEIDRAVFSGYIGAATDTGHVDPDEGPQHTVASGAFGMLRPGVPNTQLQVDYAWRSEHMMAVVSKQLAVAFYGALPDYSYWNGCSTGGRQGLEMAQRFPDDFDGIVAGSSAAHMDKFKAFNIWVHLAMRLENAGETVAVSKLTAVTNASIAACDAMDGVVDNMLRDPRACKYDARELLCKPSDRNTSACLTPGEAAAVNQMWGGARNEEKDLLWYGLQRGAKLAGGIPPGLATGDAPVAGALAQPMFWIYLDPDWDWRNLSYSNFERFFDDGVRAVGPMLATDDADLTAFRDSGAKLIMYHGWADELIVPQGSVDYYDEVVRTVGKGDLQQVQDFARLFMVPGMGHCGGGAMQFLSEIEPSYLSPLQALQRWVENGTAPDRLIAHQPPHNPDHRVRPGVIYNLTRPTCPHPAVAVYKGQGSIKEEASFVCGENIVGDDENANRVANEKLIGAPFFRPT